MNMKTRSWKAAAASQEGFTLIEVLIAIALLTIGIFAAGTMQLSALSGNSQAKQLLHSVVWGGDRLEGLMGKPYDDTELQEKKDKSIVVAGLDYTDVGGDTADYSEVVDPNFTVFWNVADDYPIFGCKTIRVIVRRTDQGIAKTMIMDFVKMNSI